MFWLDFVQLQAFIGFVMSGLHKFDAGTSGVHRGRLIRVI